MIIFLKIGLYDIKEHSLKVCFAQTLSQQANVKVGVLGALD